MSIGKLVFKLPEERDEFNTANHAYSYRLALFELDMWLRNMAKYEDKNDVSIEDVRNKIREELDGLEL